MHFRPIQPDLQGAGGLRRPRALAADAALELEGPQSGGVVELIAAREQHAAARVPNLDPLYIALFEQPLCDRGHRGLVSRAQRGCQQGSGDLTEAVCARFEIRLKLLFDRRVRQLVDIRGVDPMFVIRHTAQQQRQDRSDPQGQQQIVRFQAACHRRLIQPTGSFHPGMILVHDKAHKGPGTIAL